MPLTVRQFPCLSDNYGFLVRDDATGKTACIDTPDADAILRELDAARLGARPDPQHPLAPRPRRRQRRDQGERPAATIVGPGRGDAHRAARPQGRPTATSSSSARPGFQVIDTGGHTLGHIAYFDAADQIAFVGDTLFALGCGRLFEGTAEQMWAVLVAPGRAAGRDTAVYCAHEYTASNARFALSSTTIRR